jgi:hypothetical protein
MHVTDYGSELYAERIAPKLLGLLRARGKRLTGNRAQIPSVP